MTHISDPIRCYHSKPEWTWEWWQWRGTLHSPKLQHYWSLTLSDCLVSYPGHSKSESYPSAEMQSVYFTASADWALIEGVLPLCRDAVSVFYSLSQLGPHWGSLTPLQRCSQSILQPQPTGPSLRESYSSAEMQSLYFTASSDWALIEGILPLCRDAVSVFYSHSWLRHKFSLVKHETRK